MFHNIISQLLNQHVELYQRQNIRLLPSKSLNKNLHSLLCESSTVLHVVLSHLHITLHSQKKSNYWCCLVIFLACSNTDSKRRVLDVQEDGIPSNPICENVEK